MIEGTSLRLRGWREADLAVLTDMRNDIALQSQLLARARGSDASQVRQWLQHRSADPTGLLLILADRGNDQTLGYLQLTDIHAIDRRADLGICLHAAAQGRGVGQEALLLVLPYLRDVWALRKLSLRVRSDNSRAIACYERAGFVHCGLLRLHVHADGELRDLVLMERFVDSEGPRCAS